MTTNLDLPVVFGPRWAEQTWMAEGSCAGCIELFFAPAGEREAARLRREAKAAAVCATCPVLEPCRTYARRTGELGFWGGENDETRAEWRRRARTAAAVGRQPLAS
jgi:WhiB family redox-sensing transcriptional regulator